MRGADCVLWDEDRELDRRSGHSETSLVLTAGGRVPNGSGGVMLGLARDPTPAPDVPHLTPDTFVSSKDTRALTKSPVPCVEQA